MSDIEAPACLDVVFLMTIHSAVDVVTIAAASVLPAQTSGAQESIGNKNLHFHQHNKTDDTP